MNNLVAVHAAADIAQPWLQRYRGKRPVFACVLGFTQTALVPNISVAGETPEARQFTALADAECLFDGPTVAPDNRLPPLNAGISPALIARALLVAQGIPIYLFNAGLPHPLSIPHIDLGGQVAGCVSSGKALPLVTVQRLFEMGLAWGKRLGQRFADSYLIVGECVVGGTTTAQAVLTGLGWSVAGKLSSSHVRSNHQQKKALVAAGLKQWQSTIKAPAIFSGPWLDPLAVVAAVGDPMQPVVAGMAMAASVYSGVLLAGGSQMLAVYGLIQAIANYQEVTWERNNVIIGTTRWVIEDCSSDVVGIATMLKTAPLVSSQLSFGDSRYPQLQIFEQGYVKEGVGAGGCAIAAALYQHWQQTDLLKAVESLLDSYLTLAE